MRAKAVPPSASGSLASVRAGVRLNQTTAILLVVLCLVVVASMLSPAFLSSRNLLNVLRQAATLRVVSMGQTRGKLVAEYDGTTATEEAIMNAATGGGVAERPSRRIE